MTVKDIAEAVGKECSVTVAVGSAYLVIRATVADARLSYGRLDYLIKPEAGEGEAWVSAERVKVQ
jgi:hypothetical protein